MKNCSQPQIDMVIATRNSGKMNEMWKMLSGTTYNPLSLNDVQINEEVEETGLGAGVLNDPVESVVWLARRMTQYGQSIEPGQIILSGSFIRPVECPSGSKISADFGSFGAVDINFA